MFLPWNEESDKEKIKQKTGKRLKKPKISLKWDFYDTFMILFATKYKKYHLLYTPVNQCITNIFKLIMTLWDFSFKKTIKQPTTLPIFFTSSIRTWLLLSPLEKVIFDNFLKCNHLIIKWHFVGKRTKSYFLKWTPYSTIVSDLSTPCFTLIEQALSAFINVNYV